MSTSRPNPLAELIKARLREFYREPAIVFWVFGFPLLMAIGLGLAFRSRPPALPHVGLLDDGDGQAHLIQALEQSDRIELLRLPPEEAARALSQTKVDALVDLTPEGVIYRFDPTQETGPVARLVVDDVLQQAAGREDRLPTQDEKVSDVGSRYIDFLIPGLIGLNIMGSSMWGVGYNLVVARKRRLLRRYAVTPMKKPHFLLSYFFSRALFLVMEISVLVAFGHLVFDTQVQGSYLTLALFAVLGAASFAGVSLLIGARLDNTETANGWMNLVQLPMYVLSGAFFSYENFPEWLHLPIELLPLTAVVNSMRATYQDSASLIGLVPEMAVLLAWGAAGFLLALKSFRWQ